MLTWCALIDDEMKEGKREGKKERRIELRDLKGGKELALYVHLTAFPAYLLTVSIFLSAYNVQYIAICSYCAYLSPLAVYIFVTT